MRFGTGQFKGGPLIEVSQQEKKGVNLAKWTEKQKQQQIPLSNRVRGLYCKSRTTFFSTSIYGPNARHEVR